MVSGLVVRYFSVFSRLISGAGFGISGMDGTSEGSAKREGRDRSRKDGRETMDGEFIFMKLSSREGLSSIVLAAKSPP